jgi:hypothetical protein
VRVRLPAPRRCGLGGRSLEAPTQQREGGRRTRVAICRLDGDVRQVSGDAVRLVAQATVRALRESGTLFLGAQQLSVVCFQKAHIYVRLIYVRNRSSS